LLWSNTYFHCKGYSPVRWSTEFSSKERIKIDRHARISIHSFEKNSVKIGRKVRVIRIRVVELASSQNFIKSGSKCYLSGDKLHTNFCAYPTNPVVQRDVSML